MKTPISAALLSLSMTLLLPALTLAQASPAGGGKEPESAPPGKPGPAQGSAAKPGSPDGGAKEFIFPFKEEIEEGGAKSELKSELKCMNEKAHGADGVSYEKCRHKTTEGFDELAVKLKMVESKEKYQGLAKEKKKLVKELAALRSAKKQLKKEIRELKKKKDAGKKQLLGKLEGARERVERDLDRAVHKCNEKGASELKCGADFTPEPDGE